MELGDIRKGIDEVDAQLVELFVRRMGLAREVALYKQENGMKVFDNSRECAVRDKIKKLAGEELKDYADELYTSIFRISKAYQEQIIGQAAGDGELDESSIENK